jgi:thiamine biosynthesis protein ThiS
MQLTVNGQERELSDGATIADLLVELGLDPRMLAVEKNLELIPRGKHSATLLTAGDRVEVVTLVGGG